MSRLVVLCLLAGCDRLFGLFPLVQLEPLDATTIDAPPPTACPSGYGIEVAGSTSRYRVETQGTLDWYEAANACAMDSTTPGSYTHLVVLSHDGERAALMAHVIDDTWIGFSDIVVDDAFEWVTLESTGGYPVPRTPPWETDDPDHRGPGCVDLRPNGQIGDNSCGSDAQPFICECDGYEDQRRGR